jgi:hypothetical protein
VVFKYIHMTWQLLKLRDVALFAQNGRFVILHHIILRLQSQRGSFQTKHTIFKGH